MSYENAPQTRMLATHCAVCSRPLCDAASVELGIGPDCRKRYFAALPDETMAQREQANAVVYQIAVEQDGATVLAGAATLRLLGYAALAERVVERCASIRIAEEAGALVVRTPYDERAVAAIRQIPGRRWNPERKLWSVPATAQARGMLWTLLQRCFPGALGWSAKGPFTVPA